MDDELSFECLGEPDRPITEELCSNAGARYAAVFGQAVEIMQILVSVHIAPQIVG